MSSPGSTNPAGESRRLGSSVKKGGRTGPPRQAELTGKSARAVVPGRLRPGLPSLEHQLLADAQAAHQAMAAVRPLVEGREFHLQIGLLQINKVPLLSYASASAQLNVEHTPAVQLVACFAGDAWPAAPGAW